MEEMYYIRNEGYLGNALIWWKKDRNGYTCDIRQALKLPLEKAENLCKQRSEDTFYKCSYIDSLDKAKKLIIDSQYVCEVQRFGTKK
tara:strand:+ start:43 stop:303 length:261 start_codon:yes stop_codon:yes gene_type:complete